MRSFHRMDPISNAVAEKKILFLSILCISRRCSHYADLIRNTRVYWKWNNVHWSGTVPGSRPIKSFPVWNHKRTSQNMNILPIMLQSLWVFNQSKNRLFHWTYFFYVWKGKERISNFTFQREIAAYNAEWLMHNAQIYLLQLPHEVFLFHTEDVKSADSTKKKL